MTNTVYMFLIFLVVLISFSFLRKLVKVFESDGIIKKYVNFNEKGFSVFYADKKMDDENIISSKLLYSDKYNLNGKPDFILKHNKKDIYIPIELKSGNIGSNKEPRRGDFLQLITYFIIIEEEFYYRPKYGKLIYNDYMFIVKNKPQYRKDLLKTVKNMRRMIKTGKNNDVSPSFNKCKHCICNNTVCEVCDFG